MGDNSRRLAAADIDADGDLDLIVGRADFILGPNGIHVLTNDGSGNFVVGAPFESVPGASRAAAAVVLADVDNDGDFDLISGAGDFSGSLSIGKIAIRLNDGAGSFGAPAVHDLVLEGRFAGGRSIPSLWTLPHSCGTSECYKIRIHQKKKGAIAALP